MDKELKLHKAYDFIVGDGGVVRDGLSGPSVVKFTTVFVHGIAGSAENFAELFEFLQEHPGLNTRIVAFDLLGAGESPSGEGLDFGYDGQVEALKNALSEIEGPVVLVGHSMGTLIATRFAALYPECVAELILISPPIYTPENLKDSQFKAAMAEFQEKTKRESAEKIKSVAAFDEEMQKIIMDPENYRYLAETKQRTTLIYGEKDRVIAAFNIPGILKANASISAVETAGGHGVAEDKYEAILQALEGARK